MEGSHRAAVNGLARASYRSSREPAQAPSSSGVAAPQLPIAQRNLTIALAGLRHTFVVADPSQPDCPITFASDGCASPDLTRHIANRMPDFAPGASRASPGAAAARLQQLRCLAPPYARAVSAPKCRGQQSQPPADLARHYQVL